MTYHSFFKVHLGHMLRFELSKSKKTFRMNCDTCDKLILLGRISTHPDIAWLAGCAGHALRCIVWECAYAGEEHGGMAHECEQLALECEEQGCGKDEHDAMTNTFLAFFSGPQCTQIRKAIESEERKHGFLG
jgi:hypothetical protein